MLNLILTLVISCIVSVIVKLYFDDNGLGAYPVLTFVTVSIVSYMIISSMEMLVKF